MTILSITDPCDRSLYRMGRTHGLTATQAAANARCYATATRIGDGRGRALLDELTDSDHYRNQWDNPGSDRWLHDSDRADRCDKAAADGCDGSTHAEHIEDLRGALSDFTYLDEDDVADGFTTDIDAGRITEPDADALTAAIDGVECWHYAAGTLDDSCG